MVRELDSDIDASTPAAVYATLFVGFLDPEARTLDCVNAGHHPQFVLRAGSVGRIEGGIVRFRPGEEPFDDATMTVVTVG